MDGSTDGEGGKGLTHFPYQSLQGIKNKESFEAWLLKTFRNYLSNRTKEEERITFVDIAIDRLSDDPSPASPLTDEQKLHVVAHLIAYALQVFYPRGRFIFLRSLLTMLNKQKVQPEHFHVLPNCRTQLIVCVILVSFWLQSYKIAYSQEVNK